MFKYILGLLKNLFNPAVSLFAKVDNNSVVSRKAKIYSRVQCCCSTIGDYSYVGHNTTVIHANIGKFCSIAGEVKIGMGTHTLDKLSTSPIFTEKINGTSHSWVEVSGTNPFKRIYIGNDVWIGTRAMIMGGVTIGDGVVIGAGSIVTKDVPPYAVVVGVPARVIRYRFSPEQIDKLMIKKWWSKPDFYLRANLSLFQSDIIDTAINSLE